MRPILPAESGPEAETSPTAVAWICVGLFAAAVITAADLWPYFLLVGWFAGFPRAIRWALRADRRAADDRKLFEMEIDAELDGWLGR